MENGAFTSTRPVMTPQPLQAPRVVLNQYPSREIGNGVRINTTMTGDISSSANMAVLWTPETGRRWVLRGGWLTVLITTSLGGTAGGDVLMLLDGGTPGTDCIGCVCALERTMLAPTVLFNDVLPDLKEGIPSGAIDNVLYLGSNATIGGGIIRVSGCLWGPQIDT